MEKREENAILELMLKNVAFVLKLYIFIQIHSITIENVRENRILIYKTCRKYIFSSMQFGLKI